MLTSESTTFSLDNMGRFLCNTLQEAIDSAKESIAGRKRDFDVIVIGGGTFGSVIAESLFVNDATRSRRILVLEAGPFVLPEHVQNLPFMGGVPDMRAPWTNHPALNYSGLLFAIGGRSLSWGGWSPELLDEEMAAWPQATREALRPAAGEGYFGQASRQIGVHETNDFIYGPLHTALRKQLHAGLKAAGNVTGFTFADLLDHPVLRYPDPGPAPDAARLREWLGLAANDATPLAELKELFKLEAPLAVQSTTLPGFFPTNKFSAVPGLIRATRLASAEADGSGSVAADARKRIMVVPNCHVQELITETQPDNWVRVIGVRAWQNGGATEVFLAPPRDGRQSAVVVALGTVESTRIALTTFQQSLAGRAAQRMGSNLIAHLRSNLTIRVPRAAIAANLPPSAISSLQCSALLVKGKSGDRTFHFQITAAGLGKLGTDSEAELFKKLPTLEHMQDMLRATDNTVVVTIRGIGDMTPRNPDSFITLSATEKDFDRPKAVVSLGNAKASVQDFPGSAATNSDRATWAAMDAVSNQIALIFAGAEPFEILANAGRVIPVPAGTPAERLAVLTGFTARRDDLGTTHHDAGTLRMGTDIADSVTNEFGRIHDTTNCYVGGPALFPTVGSPNPMLTGVALGRRTADLLNTSVLPNPGIFTLTPQELAENQAAAPGTPRWKTLFDGSAATFKNWRLVCPIGPGGPVGGAGMLHVNGEMVSYGDGGLRLFYYATETFGDFTLRLQFKIFDLAKHNSGVFVRFPRPTLDLPPALAGRVASEAAFESNNPAWRPVIAGFEVQIDDNARGDATKDFYGIRPEPNGLYKNRTGAIYKIQAGDLIWHQNTNEPAVQNYAPGPALMPGIWFEYEIIVQGNDFTVFLTNIATGERRQTTTFQNTDAERGRSPGFVGIQAYSGNTVAWRNVRIKAG